MKKLVIISDSFKGSLTSQEINDLFKKEIISSGLNIDLVCINAADGGEGTVKAFSSILNGKMNFIKVHDSYMNNIKVQYFLTIDKEAYIEITSSSGLSSLKHKDPSLTTTYGVGEQIKDAIDEGAKKIYLALGGSSTNDGGCGAASALGIRFLDKNQQQFIPRGITLKDIANIDISEYQKQYKDIDFIVLSDVTNTLCGPNGAAYVFAPQKGANSAMVKALDDGLLNLANVIKHDLNKDIKNVKGSGAAGGFGGGSIAFFDAKIVSGIDFLLDKIQFDNIIKDADYIITGEGKFDKQSLEGKLISGVANRTKKMNKDLIIIAGEISNEINEKIIQNFNIKKSYSLSENKSVDYAIKNAKKLYKNTIKKLLNELVS